MYQKFIAKFSTISFWIITCMCALLPIFFLPSTWGGTNAVKGVLLYSGVFLAFSFWLLAQFVGGSIKVPKHKIFIGFVAWVVFALLSALLSKNVSVSLWGRGFAIDSFTTVLVLSMFTFLVATFAREQKRLVSLFLAAFIGSASTVLLQIILYLSQRVSFVASTLGHVANQNTLVGSWVDFAYFVTLTFVLALLIYEVLAPKKFFKILSLSTMVLCTIVLIFLNFKAAWVIATISALLVFVYKSSVERSVGKFFPSQVDSTDTEAVSDTPDTARFPVLSFVALLIGLFFFLSSNSIGATIARSVGINFTDIRPSFSATTHIMRATLGRDPFFGVGPGRFNTAWDLYHPVAVNQTQFWSSAFDSGFSMFQTLFTTNGIFAGLALLVIIILSLLHGFRLFNYQFPDRFSRFIAVASLIMFVAFVSFFVFSSPGIVLIVFGFLYLGLLLGVSTLIGRTQVVSLNYLRDPRMSFFAILLLVLAIMGGFTATYFTANRFASIVVYNRALTAPSTKGVQLHLDRALALSQNDIYWRTRATLFIREFTTAAQSDSPDKALLQNYFNQAEQSARAAVAWDTTNAINWLTLSQLYQLVANNSADAYEAARQAAAEAQSRSPHNPLYVLNQAQVAMIKNEQTTAKEFIARAIELKSDYLDAFILRAQIRTSAGETNAAVDELTQYTNSAQYNDQGYLLLAQAYLVNKNYTGALDAYNRARLVNPSNPNGLLGVINTLAAQGQKTQALEALDVFATTYPGISGVEEKRAQIQNSAPTVIEAPVEPVATPVKPATKGTKN